MIDTVVNYIGQPVSLLTALLFAGSMYLLLWWATRPEKLPPTGLLVWARESTPDAEIVAATPEPDPEPEPADWPVDEWPEHDEPGTQPIPAQPSTQPVVATTARSFQLGDDELTFNFRDRA